MKQSRALQTALFACGLVFTAAASAGGGASGSMLGNTCAGCHGTADNSQRKFELYNEELVDYLKAIWHDVNGNDTFELTPDTGLLVRIAQQEGLQIINQDERNSFFLTVYGHGNVVDNGYKPGDISFKYLANLITGFRFHFHL